MNIHHHPDNGRARQRKATHKARLAKARAAHAAVYGSFKRWLKGGRR